MELQDLTPASSSDRRRSTDTDTPKPTTVTNGYGPPEPGDPSRSQNRTTNLDLDESDLLEKFFQENRELTLRLAQVNHEYEHLRAEKTRHEVSMKKLLKEKDEECTSRMNRLREENSNLYTGLEEYEAQNKDLAAALRRAEALSDNLKAALERGDDSAMKESQKLKDASAKLQSKIQSLEAELKASIEHTGAKQKEQHVKELSRAKADLEQKLCASRGEVDELKLRLADSERKQARNLEQVSRFEAQYEVLQAQLQASQQTNWSLKVENSSLHDELQLLRVRKVQEEEVEFEEDSTFEYRLGHGLRFDGLDNDDELTRLTNESASLQAQINAHALASVLEEGNAVLVEQLRAREKELMTQLYEKDQEMQRMREQHEKEMEKLKKSVEIFGTSYATVFRRLSDAIQVQVIEPDSEFALTWPAAPMLDLDPELLPGEFASGSFTTTTDTEEDDEKQQEPLAEDAAAAEVDAEGSKTDNYDDDDEQILVPVKDLFPVPVPDLPSPSSSTYSTPVPAPASSVPSPSPIPVLIQKPASPGLEDQISKAEFEKIRAAYELEEQLLATAFYNYGLELYRQAGQSRSTPTWLDKQRFAKNANYHYEKDDSVMPRTNRRFN